VPTVWTADAGETLLQVAAIEVLVHRLADDRPEVAVFVLVALRIDLLELLVVLLDQAVERSWLAAGRVRC